MSVLRDVCAMLWIAIHLPPSSRFRTASAPVSVTPHSKTYILRMISASGWGDCTDVMICTTRPLAQSHMQSTTCALGYTVYVHSPPLSMRGCGGPRESELPERSRNATYGAVALLPLSLTCWQTLWRIPAPGIPPPRASAVAPGAVPIVYVFPEPAAHGDARGGCDW